MKKIFLKYLGVLILPVCVAHLFAAQSSQSTTLQISIKGATVSLAATDVESADINVSAYVSRGGIRTDEGIGVAVTVSSENANLPPIELLRSGSPSYALTLPRGHTYFVRVTPPNEVINGRDGTTIRRWGGPQTQVVPDLQGHVALMFYFEDAAFAR